MKRTGMIGLASIMIVILIVSLSGCTDVNQTNAPPTDYRSDLPPLFCGLEGLFALFLLDKAKRARYISTNFMLAVELKYELVTLLSALRMRSERLASYPAHPKSFTDHNN